MKILIHLLFLVLIQSCISKGKIDIFVNKKAAIATSTPIKNVTNLFVGKRSCIEHDLGLDCWGSNENGALGIPSTTSQQLIPLKIIDNTNIAGVAIGSNHTCYAIEGGVKCAGLGTSGELGNGTLVSSESFIETLPAGSKVTDIESGSGTTCAVIDEGLFCWGIGSSFQIGDGTNINRNSPVQIFPIQSNVSKVSVGERHSCAIVNTEVWCWGKNDNGQVGDSSFVDRSSPVKITSLGAGVEDLSLGGNHTCALKGGGVYCWGLNSSGQLGDGTQINRNTPTLVIAQGSTAQKISLGNAHSCALVNEELFCWGSNQYGQMNNLVSLNPFLTPTLIFGNSFNISDLALGENQVCMALQNKNVKCWGSGYLGNGYEGDSTQWPSPTEVSGLASNVTKIAKIQVLNDDGNYQNCAIHNGGVKCWGDDGSGALGNGNPLTESLITVITIPELSGVTDLALVTGTSNAGACAVLNGGVQCWGAGFGSSPVSLIPNGSSVTEVKMHQIDSFSKRWACAMALGGLKCWGTNSRGQLGDGTTTSSASPIDSIAPSSGVTDFDLGREMTCAVLNGGLKCWGRNSNGQLGDGSTTNRLSPTQIIPSSSGVTNVAIIANWVDFSGGASACAIVGGGLKCWGYNFEGMVGDGSTTDRLSPVDIFPAGSGVTKVGGRYPAVCAIKNSGLYCWGGNYGGLGVGDKVQKNSPTQVIPEGSGVTDFDLNGHVGCAVLSGGLKCWGDNSYGALGIGQIYNEELRPVEVYPAGSNVQEIELVRDNYYVSSFCARINNSMKCWGYEGTKALGHGKVSRGYFSVSGY